MSHPIQTPNELALLPDIGDHSFALCHRENATQVSQQNIENLLLLTDPSNTLSIAREGDSTAGFYPSGWVMLLDHEQAVKRAIKELEGSFEPPTDD